MRFVQFALCRVSQYHNLSHFRHNPTYVIVKVSAWKGIGTGNWMNELTRVGSGIGMWS